MARRVSGTKLFAWLLAVALPAALAGFVSAPVASAAPKLEQRGDIFIAGDADFDKEHGVRSGKGTKARPYVISNWDTSSIIIKDTSKHFVVRNNRISSQLILDWNGDRANVHHNVVNDLRVNQNVPRKGAATDGKIHHNKFSVVGQLRHWDGAFVNNTIGSPLLLSKRGTYKALQFDGFHGSKFSENKIYGYVDVKLHGHHHGSGFNKGSHYHGGEGEGEAGHPEGHQQKAVDHSRRYHDLAISNNKIFSDHAYALRYYDLDHAADDRTNASETNKFLNCPHVHFTQIAIKNNQLQGGGLVVDVFNAFDENHWDTKRGSVDIRNNTITLDRDVEDLVFSRSGITIQQAVDVNVQIAGNRVDGADMVEENDPLKLESKINRGAGVNLLALDKANVRIHDNLVRHRTIGVLASQFTKSVKWWVKDLRTADVEKRVQYDDTVSNPPNQD